LSKLANPSEAAREVSAFSQFDEFYTIAENDTEENSTSSKAFLNSFDSRMYGLPSDPPLLNSSNGISIEDASFYHDNFNGRPSVSSNASNSDSFEHVCDEELQFLEKKRKRNELESDRRQRLNEKYDELRAEIRGPKRRKDVLEAAIEMIYELKDNLSQLDQLIIYYENKLQKRIMKISGGLKLNALTTLPILPNSEYLQAQIFQHLQFPMAVLSNDGIIEGVNYFFAKLLTSNNEYSCSKNAHSLFRFLKLPSLSSLFSSLSDLISYRCDSCFFRIEFDFNRIHNAFPSANQKEIESYPGIHIWRINQPMDHFLILLTK
jgi:hypothetical protein